MTDGDITVYRYERYSGGCSIMAEFCSPISVRTVPVPYLPHWKRNMTWDVILMKKDNFGQSQERLPDTEIYVVMG